MKKTITKLMHQIIKAVTMTDEERQEIGVLLPHESQSMTAKERVEYMENK